MTHLSNGTIVSDLEAHDDNRRRHDRHLHHLGRTGPHRSRPALLTRTPRGRPTRVGLSRHVTTRRSGRPDFDVSPGLLLLQSELAGTRQFEPTQEGAGERRPAAPLRSVYSRTRPSLARPPTGRARSGLGHLCKRPFIQLFRASVAALQHRRQATPPRDPPRSERCRSISCGNPGVGGTERPRCLSK